VHDLVLGHTETT